MSSISERLKPFHDQHVHLSVGDKTKKLLKALQIPTRGDALQLYVFDWSKVDTDLQANICEQAGQDDYEIFAIIRPDASEDELEEMVDGDHSGFLMLGEDAIYVGNGEMEKLTSDLEAFVGALGIVEDEDDDDDSTEEEDSEGDDEEDSDDADDDDESAETSDDAEEEGEPRWLRITKETDWPSLSKEARFEKLSEMAQSMNWHTYDWKSSPAADLAFPDFSEEELAKKAPWLPKHYNAVSEMSVCHVPDLNGFADGDERKMMALYGIPVDWPNKKKEPQELNDLLDLLDAARREGGDKWTEAMDSHGLLNDEHYLWLRADRLGFSKQLTGNSDKIDAILKEIDEAVAAGSGAGAFAKYELRDDEHYKVFVMQYAKLKTKAWGAHNKKLDEVYAKQDAEAAQNKAAMSDQLGPVQGISLEDWARSNAKIISGATIDAILQGLKVERAAWDAANTEWNARMATDKTFTVATIYGAAFMGDAAFAAAVAKARGR